MFTVASDAFPNRAVGSVVGFGGMCGGIGGMLMLLVAGGMLQWLGSFTALFIFAGVMHPLAWIAIRALVGKNITQIDLDKRLRTAQSPALFAMGLGLVAVGTTLAALVFANWSYILSVTKNPSPPPVAPPPRACSPCDGPCAGLREPRSSARCRPSGGVIARATAPPPILSRRPSGIRVELAGEDIRL
jgi:hypothetical protein